MKLFENEKGELIVVEIPGKANSQAFKNRMESFNCEIEVIVENRYTFLGSNHGKTNQSIHNHQERREKERACSTREFR